MSNPKQESPTREELLSLVAACRYLAFYADDDESRQKALATIDLKSAEMLLLADVEVTYPAWLEEET